MLFVFDLLVSILKYRITLCLSPPHKIEDILVISISFFYFFFEKFLSKHNLRKLKKIVKLTTQNLFDPKFMRLTIFLLIDSMIFMQIIIY